MRRVALLLGLCSALGFGCKRREGPCDVQALRKALDAFDAQLEREHPSRLLRTTTNHAALDAGVLAACPGAPEHVEAHLEHYAALGAGRLVTLERPPEAARRESQAVLEKHCSVSDVEAHLASVEGRARTLEGMRVCNLPRPMAGYAIVLFHTLREFGVDEPTAVRTVGATLSGQYSIPIEDPGLLEALPQASLCDIPPALAVRLTSNELVVPPREAIRVGPSGLDEAGLAQVKAWLSWDAALEERGESPVVHVVVAADANVPAASVSQLRQILPAGYSLLVMAGDAEKRWDAVTAVSWPGSSSGTVGDVLAGLDRERVLCPPPFPFGEPMPLES